MRFLAAPLVLVASLPLISLGSMACHTGHGTGGSKGTGTTTGAGGQMSGPPPSWDRKVTPPADADAAAQRLACGYSAGALPAETQGASHPSGANIPVNHILILMQENRSFDHYFSKLPEAGQTDVEVEPSTYTNPDVNGTPTSPFHDTRYCFVDTDHSWPASHEEYDGGKMDGFAKANQDSGSPPPHPLSDSMSGTRALGYYDQTDIPFYYWVATEFSIADHYFCSLLGPTWPNREYLYGASSRGAVTNDLVSYLDQTGHCASDADCGGAAGACVNPNQSCGPNDSRCGCKGTCKSDADCGKDAPVGTCDVAHGGVCAPVGRTIFDYMEQRHINWKVYGDGTPGYAVAFDALLKYNAAHHHTIAEYMADAAAGTLPDVAFIDPHLGMEAYNQDDEHPPAAPFPGQLFVAKIVDALTKSPEWSSSALFITYDEHGGLFDHVPPPNACPPGDVPPKLGPNDPPGGFDRYGVRVPMLLVSPFAKKHFVAHHVYDHTSILRFVEDRFVLPAITNRDANAEEPWEMFDFGGAPHAMAPSVTLPDIQQAKIDPCKAVWLQ